MLMQFKGTADLRGTSPPSVSDCDLPPKVENQEIVFPDKQSLSLATGRMETYMFNDNGDLMTQYGPDDDNLDVLIEELDYAAGTVVHWGQVCFRQQPSIADENTAAGVLCHIQ
jgi:hypothetical protein